MTLELFGLKEIPLVKKGDNIAKIIEDDLNEENIQLENVENEAVEAEEPAEAVEATEE